MLSQIVGYMSPAGMLVRSVFRDRYEHGGVFLLDEVDAGNANVLTAINSALANGQCAFPDGMVQRHKDFVCIAAGNTFGIGANRVYVGRCQIDGATRDRFAFLEFPYDEKLEEALCNNADWCARVRSVRDAVLKLGVRHVVSPRASISGARMLSAGFALADVENMVLWRGLDSDARSRVEESIA
jgi:MoxR-like ATPase